MKIILSLFVLIFLSGCDGILDNSQYVESLNKEYQQKQEETKTKRPGEFTVIREFYLFDGDSNKMKLVKHKKTGVCYLYSHYYKSVYQSSSESRIMTPAYCDM